MKAILLRIEHLLTLYFEAQRAHLLELKEASMREVWLDSTTTRTELKISDRTLYNYASQGKLISEKRGMLNVYLESSVLELKKKLRR